MTLLLVFALQVVGLQTVGYRDGQPVAFPVYDVSQVVASPEWATILRSRNARNLAEHRARAETVSQNGGDRTNVVGYQPSDRISEAPPLIVWRPAVERWRGLVHAYFGDQAEHALAIIRCESVGDPTAVNDSDPDPGEWVYGLFQHKHRYWEDRSRRAGWPGANIMNPEANVAVAAWLVQEDGWWHWSGAAWGVEGCEEWAQAQLGEPDV